MANDRPLFDDEDLPGWLTNAGITHAGKPSQPQPPDTQSGAPGQPGGTGALPWQQSAAPLTGTASDTSADEQLALDWQQTPAATPTDGQSSGYGVTGALPWRQGVSDSSPQDTGQAIDPLASLPWQTSGPAQPPDAPAGSATDDAAWMGSFPSHGDLPEQIQHEESLEMPAEAPPAPTGLTGLTGLKGLKAFARPDEETSPVEPTVKAVLTDDLDWLSAAMPTEESAPAPVEAAPVSSAVSDDLSWLDSTSVSETAPEQAESTLAASDEADLDWLGSALTESTESPAEQAAAQESTPIKSIKRLPKTDEVSAEQSEPPRAIKKLPKTEEQPAVRTIKKLPTGTPEPSSYEDWERNQLAAEQPTQPAESLVDEVPDWFQTTGAPAPAADDVPDWFKNVQQPPQAQSQPQDDVPDWFRSMDLTSTPLAGPVQTPAPAAAPVPAAPAPAEEVPDWFKGAGAGADNLDFNAMFGVTG